LNRSARLLTLVLAELPAVAYGGPTAMVCTESFGAYAVNVRDLAGAPLAGASLVATVRRTGQRLTPPTTILYIVGTYPVIDDGSREALRQNGDEVRVLVSKGGASVQADYLFDVPDGCHIHKVAGPDTIVLP
jgi:hypothetical protein